MDEMLNEPLVPLAVPPPPDMPPPPKRLTQNEVTPRLSRIHTGHKKMSIAREAFIKKCVDDALEAEDGDNYYNDPDQFRPPTPPFEDKLEVKDDAPFLHEKATFMRTPRDIEVEYEEVEEVERVRKEAQQERQEGRPASPRRPLRGRGRDRAHPA